MSYFGVDDSGLSRYLEQVAQHPILTREEELRLTRVWRGRDKQTPTRGEFAARRELIRCNMKLVISVAKGYRNRGLPFIDVIQEGVIGISHAIDKFEPGRGHKLSTYATWWIRQACQRATSNYGGTIRVPAYVNIHRARAYRALGENPDLSREELAELLECDVRDVDRALNVAEVTSSLDETISFANDSSQALVNLIADNSALDPADVVASRDTGYDVRKALACLQDDERRVIELRFGFDDEVPLGFDQVSKRMGIPHHRAQALQKVALRKLGHILESDVDAPTRSRLLTHYAEFDYADFELAEDELVLGRCGYIGSDHVEEDEDEC